ncbi:putative membrane protein YadS [Herbaspirillum sp. Sphag1AN]|uniref:putative sulfate exporter family transporter n=1 Tax=unclassified Herbaspirillum TaxID=2624150 RepID=UPI00161F6332|nr:MULTISPECIES: putative sulfate exporter family transporter [unclassified Herbaspirillum]MBB3213231.1 putative membrane protein YadS [Herbaspirillum sp. Sphag1AN]MBB3246428.1 putative membrane protein YadS [Herbaspirillum sp. Sphag64]
MSNATIANAVNSQVGEHASFNEDWLALIIGLLIFVLALTGLGSNNLLGWVVTTSVWHDPVGALAPTAKSYAALGGAGALLATYVALLLVLSVSASLLKLNVRRFAASFTVVFALAYLSWFIGNYARLAAVTPADLTKFGIDWSLRLTNEGGFVVALLIGLIISNFFPRFADWLKEAIRPELYIKIAIVILGGFIAVTIAGKLSLATSVLLRGLAAIVEAYLIYWAVVYFVARKWFGFNREWAVPLASGISICGVAAAISTGGAIRSRPAVPVLVSSLVVIFAVVEVLILPFVAQTFLSHEPLVAAAWLGLAVKTDGAAVAAGGITEALIQAKNAAEGIHYQAGWILGTTATVKVFIDVFIGVWSFVLAYIWTNHINVKAGGKAKASEIWERFPKFIIGFLVTFLIGFYLATTSSPETLAKLTPSVGVANTFRVIFFILTFFSIGVLSNFRKLWEEGLGKLVAVYVVSLFGFVIWVGLLVSWIFFSGVKPPLAG